MRTITILGATGSIGQNTLDVLSRHTGDFSVYALTAHSQVSAMAELCLTHRPKYAVMGSSQAANDLKEQLSGKVSTVVLYGLEALI